MLFTTFDKYVPPVGRIRFNSLVKAVRSAMTYTEVLRSRAFSEAPIRTIVRGSEWVMRQNINIPRSFVVEFGSYRFRMRLQSTKLHHGSAGIFLARRYYEPLLEFGSRFISSGDHVIDGGASQGVYSCAFAAAVGVNGQVYAFEPQAYAIKCITTNLELNNFANVLTFEAALSDISGSEFLNLYHEPNSASISWRPSGCNGVSVKSYSIDDLLFAGKIQEVQFIKLDVERAELKVLQGSKAMIELSHPTICIEAENATLYNEILGYLGKWGYRPFEFDDRGSLVSFGNFRPLRNVFFLR